ncbi:uncharacterized protein BO95DRAFT_461629 [Aspergillus brunneoviolaceus CBS 621.78]|uniref:Uncharacterized protein n=1 Tax=Aspergillus brunneoviolaceus CBS 621.78 TaxID=1450534 RepID=A0ACD1GF04_9EURO|nr:hypothetical protein BO95DRAFT_461629 [Aspergillus brunneoviolaceus CBS 621.78]RAH47879.1 hypothetical protein BO95DRAFT_461629 [Aspergillus brunneoviolaceus CBS 621.78]
MPPRRNPFMILQLIELKAVVEAMLSDLEADWARGHRSRTDLEEMHSFRNLLAHVCREIEVRQRTGPGLPKL